MNLVSIRIITARLEELVKFYELITGVTAVQYTPDFAEVKTPATTLAIGSTKTLQFLEVTRLQNQLKTIVLLLNFVQMMLNKTITDWPTAFKTKSFKNPQ